ncbi:MAG: DMT family transporter [Gemmatimonadales bacterium]|nr:DMT family transporter [Gemmatimonadales bacterium]
MEQKGNSVLANTSSGRDSVDNMPKAMAWMILSGFSFALMGAMVKLSGDVALPTKVFFRNLVTLGLTTLVAIRTGENVLASTPNAWRLIFRSVFGLCGVTLYFFALGRMNLADASLLNKTSPFFASGLAVLLLGERFHRALIPALAAAFIGAMLVIKPQFDYSALPAMAGLGSGLFAGMAYTVVRSLKGKESPNRIIFTFSLVSSLATLPFLIASPPQPTVGQWWTLAGTGVFAAGGQFGLTFAYHHARVSRISLFTYLHVLFALVVGFVLWGERPDLYSWLGGLLIIGAAMQAHRAGRNDGRERQQ